MFGFDDETYGDRIYIRVLRTQRDSVYTALKCPVVFYTPG